MEYGCSQVGAICATHKKPQALGEISELGRGDETELYKKAFI